MDADGTTVERLLREGKVVVIDYYATWCGPCKSYSPKFQRIEREMRRAFPKKAFAFVSVDVDRAQDIARDANVRSVPTTAAYVMGRSLFGRPKRKEILRYSGDRPWAEMVQTFTNLLDERA